MPGRNSQPSVRGAQRRALTTTGGPKWALGAWKVRRGLAGADLPRRLPSFRQVVLSAATRILES